MDNSFACKNSRRFRKIITHISLLSNPIEITSYALRQTYLRFVPDLPDELGATCKVSDLPRTKVTSYFGRDANAQRIGNQRGYLPNAHSLAAPDVYSKSVKLVRLGRDQIRPSNVFNE